MTLEECISNGKEIKAVVAHEGVFVTILSATPDASGDSLTLSGTDFNYTRHNFCSPDQAFLNSLQQYKQQLEQAKSILMENFSTDNASFSDLERIYQFLPISWKEPLQKIISCISDLYSSLVGRKTFKEVIKKDVELSLSQLLGYDLCHDFFCRGYEILERENTVSGPLNASPIHTATSEVIKDITLLYDDLVLRTNKIIELEQAEHLFYYNKPLELPTTISAQQGLLEEVLPNNR